MWYSVQNDAHDPQETFKIQGVTYRMYPKESSVRTGWMVALGVEDWVPRAKSEAPVVTQVCRICLATNSKLQPIRTNKLKQAYEQLTGISLQTEDCLPQKLCAECAQRLLSCNRFRNKTLRANSLMLEIVNKQNRLTIQDIKALSLKLSPDHSDTNVIKKLEKTPPILQEQSPSPAPVIKQEHEILITKDVVIKHDNNIQENEFLNEDSQDDVDKEFDIATDQNYSSDDSLPLQKCKEEKLKKKKEVKVKTPVESAKKVKQPAKPKNDGQKNKPRQPLGDNDERRMFTITNLSFDEQIAEILKRQDSSNYKNAVFKCTACFKGFLDEDAYNSHLIRHTNQSGEFECEICKIHHTSAYALKRHIVAHHTQRYSCNECPYVASTRQAVKIHVRLHKGTKYNCPHCPREFLNFTTYMGHLRIRHPSDFVCEVCGFSFVSAKGIEIHKRLKHRFDNTQVPEDGPLCELCNVRFVSAKAHERHLSISSKHTTGKGGKRRLLNRPQTSEEILSRYREIRRKNMAEGPDGPIACELCELPLLNYRAYHVHFRRMHPDMTRTNYPQLKSSRAMCEFCGKLFQSNALLQIHILIHTGERPFKCDTCGKTFRMKVNLDNHQQVHSLVRTTFECPTCGKHFSSFGNRHRHMFIHTGLRPYKCETCEKTFRTRAEKNSHITYVHLKKPWPKRNRGKRQPATTQNLDDQKDPSDNERRSASPK